MTTSTQPQQDTERRIGQADRRASNYPLPDSPLFQSWNPNQSPDLVANEAVTAYYDLVEQTVRVARRISEAQALTSMRQQIVQDCTQQVLSALQQAQKSQYPSSHS